MTQSSLQTQCPKCETQFRVTDAQLSVATGKVRCGNCMSVFNAVEHKIADTPSSPAPADKPESAASEGSQPSRSEDNFLFADDPEEDAADGPYAGTRLTFSDDELSDSFRSVGERTASHGFTTDSEEEPENSVDESWAEEMLSEDPDTRAKTSDSVTDKTDAESESEPEPKLEPEKAPEPEPAWQEPEFQATEPEPEPVTEKDDYDGFFIDESETENFDHDTSPEPAAPESPYGNLRQEPVAASGGGSGRLKSFFWILVIIALVAGAISQVVHYQFDRLSAIPELRPFYAKACQFTGCQLKPLIDVQSIQSRKLVVKTDPENRSQLIVDAVIINRASFEQPFPAIALTFSNLNGDVVAQSVFTPEEYLAGEGKDLDAIPTDTPVRILINIRDPGKDAVNYTIVFRAHEP